MFTGREFLEKIFKNKKLISMFLLGLMLVVLSGVFAENNKPKPEEKTEFVFMDEKKLSEILSNIKGAGTVDVYITYRNTGEKIVAYDSDKEEKTVVNSGKDNEPYVLSTNYPKIKGVLVAASGAENEVVKNRLIKCIKAVCDIPYNNICVEIRK